MLRCYQHGFHYSRITDSHFVEISTEGAFGAQPAVTYWVFMSTDDGDKERKKKSTWVGKRPGVWYMRKQEIKYWQGEERLFSAHTLTQISESTESQFWIRRQQQDKKHNRTTLICHPDVIFLVWLILFHTQTHTYAHTCMGALFVSLSLLLCLFWPFGLCHLRAYRKLWSPGWVWLRTAPYWDKKTEGFCQEHRLHRPREPVQQRCLNQGEANTHNGAHTKTCLLWHGRVMCKSTPNNIFDGIWSKLVQKFIHCFPKCWLETLLYWQQLCVTSSTWLPRLDLSSGNLE